MTTFDEVGHFVADEFAMLGGRLVGSALEQSFTFVEAPGLSGHQDRGAVV